DANLTLTRGTTGLGLHLVSERRGKGAVITRRVDAPSDCFLRVVVPDSAASHVLRAGDVLKTVAGVDIRLLWSLENIKRLLGFRNRVKLQIRRVSHLLTNESKTEEDDTHPSVSCYACIDGDTSNLHAFECALAPFGGKLPPFSSTSSALPVIVAQPFDHCTRGQTFNTSRFALLVSRGGCLPEVKARNAAWGGAEVMVLVDGQYPPFSPVPTAPGDEPFVEVDASGTRFRQLPAIGIPVVIIRNDTGYRIVSEVRDRGRDVATFFHAGFQTARSIVSARKQTPPDEAESLQSPRDAVSLKSSFRDGQVMFGFGEPGLSGGKTPTTFLQVSCGLENLMTGLKTRVQFGKVAPCSVCNGRGAPAEDMRPCKVCSSSDEPGTATVEHNHGLEVKQSLKTTCPLCQGFGENLKRGSPRCERDRIIQEHASLDVQIPKGAPDRFRIAYSAVGSQLLGRAAGDVEVIVNVKPHESFQRDGSTLRTELPITLAEALTGFTREVQLLNGTTFLLNRTQMTNNNDQIEIRGGGLPVWDPAAAEKHGVGVSNGARTRGRGIDELGSMIVTCTVALPDPRESDLKGVEDA
ncbi:unnamed protein product, partial [Scytosiphon promiscuus]